MAGVLCGGAVFLALLYGPGRWCYLPHLFDDWIFARDYVRRSDPTLDQRMEHRRRDRAARGGEADEILVVAHSLGRCSRSTSSTGRFGLIRSWVAPARWRS